MRRFKWSATVFNYRRSESDFRGAGLPVNVIVRVGRWSEANEDIFALRKFAKDGPLSVEPESGKLLTASLAVAMVKPDSSGNVRMVKRTASTTLPATM